MGNTADTVAKMYNLKRPDLDEFAVNSHLKAAKAVKSGKFKGHVVPIKAKVKGKDGKVSEVLVSQDDGFRENSSVQA